MPATTNFPVPEYSLSTHAKMRMQQRGIGRNQLEHVLRYGRAVRAHGGASFYVLGRKETQRDGAHDADLLDAEGVHLILSAEGVVITVYRSHALRKLRFQKQHRRVTH